jgi:hypothetical protein
MAPGWGPQRWQQGRLGTLLSAPVFSAGAPLLFFLSSSPFSCGGQGQHPQVAAADRELRLGTSYSGRLGFKGGGWTADGYFGRHGAHLRMPVLQEAAAMEGP